MPTLFATAGAALGTAGSIAAHIWSLRLPLVIALVSYILLAKPGQILELYVIYLSDGQHIAQIVFLTLGVAGLSVLLVLIAHRMLSDMPEEDLPPIERLLLPLLLAALPWIGLVEGLHEAKGLVVKKDLVDVVNLVKELDGRQLPDGSGSFKFPVDISSIRDSVGQLEKVKAWIFKLIIAVGVATLALVLLFWTAAVTRPLAITYWARAVTGPRALVTALGLFGGIVVLFALSTVALQDGSQLVGTIGLVMLFLCLLLVTLTALQIRLGADGLLIMLGIVVYAGFLSWHGWTDNHDVEIIQQPELVKWASSLNRVGCPLLV